MPWRIDKQLRIVEYFIGSDVKHQYSLPRTGREVVSLLSQVMDTPATREEIAVLLVMLSGSVKD